jgi:cell division protein FtsB
MALAGRLAGADGEQLTFAGDLRTNLEGADRLFDERFRGTIDSFIERAGIEAPPPDEVAVTYEPPELTELNLSRAGISTVIWATGYDLDYSWIDAPILDPLGYPKNVRGVSAVPGLYFLGLLWQHSQASALAARPGTRRPLPHGCDEPNPDWTRRRSPLGLEGGRMQARRRTSIRWDRLGRLALLGTLLVILLLYLSPAKHWLQQSATAGAQRDELSELNEENRRLKQRVRALRDPGALEREARRLGMVRQGERAYVIEGLPR